MIRSAFSIAAGLATATLLATDAFAQQQDGCLAYRNIRELEAIDQTTAVARTGRDSWTITFRGRCMARPTGASFIRTDATSGICVQRGDRLAITAPHPPCTVESVSLRPEDAR